MPCATAFAQTNSTTPVDFSVWPEYEGNHELVNDSPWRFVADGVVKRSKGIFSSEAYLLEGGLGHEWKRDLQVAGGYGFQRHLPFDRSSQPYAWTEHRIFEELKFPVGIGKGNKTIKQKIRFEERWLARKSAPDFDRVTSYKFEVRPIYQFRLVLPLTPETDAVFYDEVRLRVVPTNENHFDQNRLFGGISRKTELLFFSRIEMGYMLQTVRDSSANGRARVNHVLRITFVSDAPLRKK
jgi:hypothetical protein